MQFSQSLNQPALRYQGYYYPLNKPQIIIGSDPNCDIRIENNPRVLPMHVQIISQGGQVFLQYMERGAAIWVNGLPASQQMLQDQDTIMLGDQDTRLTLQLNWNATGAEQSVTLARRVQPGNTHAPQNGPAIGHYWAPDPGSSYGAGLAPQQLSPTRPAVAQGQIPPGIATTPPLGVAPGFAAAPQPTPQMTFAPAPQVPGSAHTSKSVGTNTTRYLCAAGHLDEGFQDYVMRHVIYEERRALGESYGVDMLAVVSWCKAGRARINVRDSILGIFFLLICSIIVVRVIQEISPVLQEMSQANQYGYTIPFPAVLGLLLGTGLGLALGLLIVLLIALGIETAIKHFWRNSHPGFVSLLVLMVLLGQFIPFGFSFLITLALWLTIFIELIARYYGESINRLRKGAFNPQARPAELDGNLEAKLRENFTTRQRNVVAYSGYKPFAGAGYYQNGWSFVIDMSKGSPNPVAPAESLTPQPFTVGSLYSMVEKDVQALGVTDVLEVEGKLYVHGQFLPENPPFFNAAAMRPVTSVDPQLVERYKEHPTEDVRYYQCLRFNFWRGEMIFTAFLRFIQRGKDLFAEMDYLLLPPMKDDYYWVDRKEITPTAGKIWQLFKRSFDGPLNMWFGVPGRLLRGPAYAAQQQKLARVAQNNPAFDYGAATSLRWEASDDSYHLFFQKLDEEMYLKIVEKQVLETIINFLDAHQVDTAELRERQQTILNNNTYVSGQTITIGAMATGQGGQATNQPASSPRSGTPRASGQAQPLAQP